MSQPVVLWQMGRFWGIPNASPFCVKLETWLRLAGVPHEARSLDGPPRSKTGKVPYVDLPDGTQLVDSARIIEELTRRYEVTLDEGLSDEDRARAHAITRLVEDSLYWSLGSERWKNDAHYPITRDAYFAAAPGFLRWLVAGFVRRKVIQAMHGQGIGREDDAWAVRRGKADLEALAGLLGDRPFFLGDKPRTVDATVFGTLTNLRHAPYPSPLTDAMCANQKLCAFEERIRALAWPDWGELPA